MKSLPPALIHKRSLPREGFYETLKRRVIQQDAEMTRQFEGLARQFQAAEEKRNSGQAVLPRLRSRPTSFISISITQH